MTSPRRARRRVSSFAAENSKDVAILSSRSCGGRRRVLLVLLVVLIAQAPSRDDDEQQCDRDDMHVERSSLNEQQEALEEDRRDIATQRVREPLIANALQAFWLLLACLAPLLICVYALKQAGESPPELELGTLLVEELTSEEPQLIPALSPPLHRPELVAAEAPSLLTPAEAADGQ